MPLFWAAASIADAYRRWRRDQPELELPADRIFRALMTLQLAPQEVLSVYTRAGSLDDRARAVVPPWELASSVKPPSPPPKPVYTPQVTITENGDEDRETVSVGVPATPAIPRSPTVAPCCCCVKSLKIANLRRATADDLDAFMGSRGLAGHCFDVQVEFSRMLLPGGRCTLKWFEYGIIRPAPGSFAPKDALHSDKMVGHWGDMYDKDSPMFEPWESAFGASDCPETSIKITDCPAAIGNRKKRPGGGYASSNYERWLFIIIVGRSGCPGCPPKIAWFKQYIHVTGYTVVEDSSITEVEEPIRAQGGTGYIPPDMPDPASIPGLVDG